jgi:hypothetical protein
MNGQIKVEIADEAGQEARCLARDLHAPRPAIYAHAQTTLTTAAAYVWLDFLRSTGARAEEIAAGLLISWPRKAVTGV